MLLVRSGVLLKRLVGSKEVAWLRFVKSARRSRFGNVHPFQFRTDALADSTCQSSPIPRAKFTRLVHSECPLQPLTGIGNCRSLRCVAPRFAAGVCRLAKSSGPCSCTSGALDTFIKSCRRLRPEVCAPWVHFSASFRPRRSVVPVAVSISSASERVGSHTPCFSDEVFVTRSLCNRVALFGGWIGEVRTRYGPFSFSRTRRPLSTHRGKPSIFVFCSPQQFGRESPADHVGNSAGWRISLDPVGHYSQG